MPEPLVLLDFDRTLFDTPRFMEDFYMLLTKEFGIDGQAARQTYPQAYVPVGGLQYYDFSVHMALLGAGADPVADAVRGKFGADRYIYDDVAGFLDAVHDTGSAAAIVTFGMHSFQRLKYDISPAVQGLPFNDVLTEKAEYIASAYAGRQGVIIDDRAVEALPSGFRHIWISREGEQGRYHTLTAILPELHPVA